MDLERSAAHDGALGIHVQSLRLLVTMMLPEIARLTPRPEAWLADMEAVLLRVADQSTFPATSAISPELTKAAVMGSLEETFSGVRALLGIGDAGPADGRPVEGRPAVTLE